MGIGTVTRLQRYAKRSDQAPHLEHADADEILDPQWLVFRP